MLKIIPPCSGNSCFQATVGIGSGIAGRWQCSSTSLLPGPTASKVKVSSIALDRIGRLAADRLQNRKDIRRYNMIQHESA